jgi:hypothetical protein
MEHHNQILPEALKLATEQIAASGPDTGLTAAEVEVLCSGIALLSALLAIFDNYRLTWKNASFALDNKILPNPLGERIAVNDYHVRLP